MTEYIYPGSFDLFHSGHLHILQKAKEKYENITIIIANNCRKKHNHNLIYRKKYIENIIKINNINGIKIEINDEKYLADYMKKNNITKYIRGYRNIIDYKYEMQLLKIYKKRNKDIELILFKCDKNYKNMSSSNLIKKIV